MSTRYLDELKLQLLSATRLGGAPISRQRMATGTPPRRSQLKNRLKEINSELRENREEHDVLEEMLAGAKARYAIDDAPPPIRSTDVAAYRSILDALEDVNTKRMLFDARQADLFLDLAVAGEKIPMGVQSKLRLPYDQMYIEFTEPLALPVDEPEHAEYLRALMIVPSGLKVEMPYRPNEEGEDYFFGDDKGDQTMDMGRVVQVTAFLKSRNPIEAGRFEYVDRNFKLALDMGYALVTPRDAADNGSAIGEWPLGTREGYIPATARLQWCSDDERVIGWWETFTDLMAKTISYMLAYMMAKGVVIQPEVMSRVARRRRERGKEPKPWHVVRVEPKFLSSFGPPREEGTGAHHSYRYDVIGHLRFGKHKRGDGSYSHTVEWVQPHQRGLRHSRYIPKTHKYERGKTVHTRMQEYWRDEVKVG